MNAAEGAHPGLIAWFRPDIRGAVSRAWLRAFGFVAAAVLVLAVPMGIGDTSTALRILCWVVGGGFLLAGPMSLLWRLQRILSPEIVLSVHQRGIRWQEEATERVIAWVSIEHIRLSPAHDAVVIDVEAPGEPLVLATRFMDVSHEALVDLLQDYRRKALMGLPLSPRPG